MPGGIMGICDWRKSERPRERLEALGAQALSNAELLAIVLRTGVKGVSAVDLGRKLLDEFGGLVGVFAAKGSELLEYPGMGMAKVSLFEAITEIYRRILLEQAKDAPILTDPDNIFRLIQFSIRDRAREFLYGLMLNEQNKLIKVVALAKGSLSKFHIHPKELAKEALLCGAVKVVLAHNHPSDELAPSKKDESLTREFVRFCTLLEIKIIDHVIVGNNSFFSFAREGLM